MHGALAAVVALRQMLVLNLGAYSAHQKRGLDDMHPLHVVASQPMRCPPSRLPLSTYKPW
jgi:hypothetical protein